MIDELIQLMTSERRRRRRRRREETIIYRATRGEDWWRIMFIMLPFNSDSYYLRINRDIVPVVPTTLDTAEVEHSELLRVIGYCVLSIVRIVARTRVFFGALEQHQLPPRAAAASQRRRSLIERQRRARSYCLHLLFCRMELFTKRCASTSGTSSSIAALQRKVQKGFPAGDARAIKKIINIQ